MTRWKRNTCFVLYSVMISSARVLALCCLYSCLLFFHPSLMLDSRLLCLLVWSSILCSCVHFCISSLHFCLFCSLLLSSSLLSACVVGDCFLGSSQFSALVDTSLLFSGHWLFSWDAPHTNTKKRHNSSKKKRQARKQKVLTHRKQNNRIHTNDNANLTLTY